MTETRYLDRQLQPITALQADTLLGDRDYRVIDETHAGDHHIYTEWTATGPSINGQSAVFTTRVYIGDQIDDQHARLYTSEAAARAGHAETVSAVTA